MTNRLVPYVQNHGKDTDIRMSSVRLFESEDKYTKVYWLSSGHIERMLVIWPLKNIVEFHGETIIRLSRNRLVAMKDLKKLEQVDGVWHATIVWWDGTTRSYHVSRRCKPMVNQYLKGRDATTSTA